MELYLDRKRSLLPRINFLYLLSRLMLLAVLGGYVLLDARPGSHSPMMLIMLGTLAVQIGLFALALKGSIDASTAYLTSIIYDLVLVPVLVMQTGGVDSSFYLILCLTVSAAAYVLTFPFAVSVAIVGTLSYVVVVFRQIDLNNYFDVTLRVGFIWVYYLVVTYAIDYFRRSENRLLGLFNTLNKRTSELEKSQAQLEVIYENSRVLASILDTSGLVREMSRILGSVLQYVNHAIVLKQKDEQYYYLARSAEGQASFDTHPVQFPEMDLIRRVGELGEAVRIRDLSTRNDYGGPNNKARSVMAVPMVARGFTRGVLIADSTAPDAFSERDLQLLSIVARSAVLALENAELHKQTEELTIIDELTETYNFRYFQRKLVEERRRAARYRLPLSIIMVDIDWFKRFNDTYGHEAGNVVLKSLSQVIKSCIRDVDVFARYGGEEFVVILPQTNLESAKTIGERIREQVESTDITIPELGVKRITVSVGVSSFPENGKPEDELVSAADKALYRAKGEGRNLVCTL